MILLTFNVQHLRNYITKNIDSNIFIETIKDINPDIISLNEVFGNGSLELYGDQVKLLASNLNMNYYFGKAISIDKGNYGNAVLSKYEINNPMTIKILDPIEKNENVYYESRIIIKAKINGLLVYVTHLGLAKAEQINGINELINLIKDEKDPFVIMGDFNMEPTNSILLPLNDYVIDPLIDCSDKTFPSDNPNRRIDYIFLSKNIKKYKVEVVKKVVSDHLPVKINIEI